MIHDINKQIEELEKEICNLETIFKIRDKKVTIQELQLKMSEKGFWDNSNSASEVVNKLKDIKGDIDAWDRLNNALKDLKDLFSICDESIVSDIMKELNQLKVNSESLKLRILFSGKFDKASAIVEINSGAGGTESCDWASMLFRMYFKWSEDKGFKFKVLNEVRGEEAGIKSISFFVEGNRAFGLLKTEIGVHRLVRISPFDSNKRRHTSFASVDVIPEIKGDIEIDIKPDDVRIDTYRSSGAGGQHVNVTDSAVRITHLLTGIVVSCQNERSQHQNKLTAFNVLKAKLYKLKEDEERKELVDMSGHKQRVEWGSQIRSYVLHPYLLVKDHRTNIENHNAWAVLDGQIDGFIYSYLKQTVSI